jgi:WD40 repeat protein
MYDAFISYSHAADGQLAPAVQRGLERFAKPWHRLRALRVFRDETGLTVNPHLWGSIQQALDASTRFVLLCSPESAASPWVNRELEHWLTSKTADSILPVLTSGELAWDDAGGDFTEVSAAPRALRGVFSAEPRFLDLRWARAETDLDLRHSRFRDAIADLAAPMHGLAKDDLESEDVRQHRRARRLARGATTVLALLLALTLALGAIALDQRRSAQKSAATARREAEVARRQATTMLARALAGESSNTLEAGRNDLSLLLAVESEHTESSVASRSSLLQALVDQPALEWQLDGLTGTTTALAFSPDGHLLAASDGSYTRVWDLRSRRALDRQPAFAVVGNQQGRLSAGLEFADTGRVLVGEATSATQSYALVAWDVADGRELRRVPATRGAWATSADAPVLAVDSGGTVVVSDIRTGATIGSIADALPPYSPLEGSDPRIALSPDGSVLAVAARTNGIDRVTVLNVATGQAIGRGCELTSADRGEWFLGLDVAADNSTARISSTDSVGKTDVGPENAVFTARCDARAGSLESRQAYGGVGSVRGVSPDGTIVAVSRDVADITLVDTTTGSETTGATHAPYNGPMFTLPGTVVFSPDARLFAARELAGNVRVWRSSGRSAIERIDDLEAQLARELQSQGARVARSPGGLVVVSESGDIVDGLSRQRVGRLPEAPGANPVALSADGRVLAAWTAKGLTVIDLRDNSTRTNQVHLACTPSPIPVALAVSARIVAAACDSGALQAIDISTPAWRPGPPVRSAFGVGVPLEFSRDGRVLATVSSFGCCGGLQLFDVEGTRLKARPPMPERGVTIAFTPDSHAIVIGHGSQLVELVPLAPNSTPTILAAPAARTGSVLGVSSDGQVVATAGPGSGIGLWDLDTKQLLGTIPLPQGGGIVLRYATFTATALVLVDETTDTAQYSDQYTAHYFDLDPTSWRRKACAIANRNLTAAEWDRYLPGIPYRETCPDLP